MAALAFMPGCIKQEALASIKPGVAIKEEVSSVYAEEISPVHNEMISSVYRKENLRYVGRIENERGGLNFRKMLFCEPFGLRFGGFH